MCSGGIHHILAKNFTGIYSNKRKTITIILTHYIPYHDRDSNWQHALCRVWALPIYLPCWILKGLFPLSSWLPVNKIVCPVTWMFIAGTSYCTQNFPLSASAVVQGAKNSKLVIPAHFFPRSCDPLLTITLKQRRYTSGISYAIDFLSRRKRERVEQPPYTTMELVCYISTEPSVSFGAIGAIRLSINFKCTTTANLHILNCSLFLITFTCHVICEIYAEELASLGISRTIACSQTVEFTI